MTTENRLKSLVYYYNGICYGSDIDLNKRVANVDLNRLGTRVYTDQSDLSYRLDENNVDISFYANRKRSYDEVAPWSHLDYLVSHEFLVRENKKAHLAQTTRNCKEGCSGCGIKPECGGVYCGGKKTST